MRRRKRKPDLGSENAQAAPLADDAIHVSSTPQQNVLSAREREKRSAGHTLDTGIRQKMERLLDQDFGSVTIHSDSNANEAAELRQAKAYVRDRDIYFGRAQYDVNSEHGVEVLAHELVHIAQTDGRTKNEDEGYAQPEQQIEKQATAAASSVLQTTPAERN